MFAIVFKPNRIDGRGSFDIDFVSGIFILFILQRHRDGYIEIVSGDFGQRAQNNHDDRIRADDIVVGDNIHFHASFFRILLILDVEIQGIVLPFFRLKFPGFPERLPGSIYGRQLPRKPHAVIGDFKIAAFFVILRKSDTSFRNTYGSFVRREILPDPFRIIDGDLRIGQRAFNLCLGGLVGLYGEFFASREIRTGESRIRVIARGYLCCVGSGCQCNFFRHILPRGISFQRPSVLVPDDYGIISFRTSYRYGGSRLGIEAYLQLQQSVTLLFDPVVLAGEKRTGK